MPTDDKKTSLVREGIDGFHQAPGKPGKVQPTVDGSKPVTAAFPMPHSPAGS